MRESIENLKTNSMATEFNWKAFQLTIISNNSIDSSLGIMGIRPHNKKNNFLNLTEQQALNLKFLHESMTWTEIAKEFDINAEALRQQVSKVFKKTTKELCKATSVVQLKNISV